MSWVGGAGRWILRLVQVGWRLQLVDSVPSGISSLGPTKSTASIMRNRVESSRLLARCCSTRRDGTAEFTSPETVIRGLVLAASDVARAWDFCFEERPQTAQNLFQETPKSTTFLRGPQRPLSKLLQLAKMAL